MEWRKVLFGIAAAVFALALFSGITAAAQRTPVLVRSAIAGEMAATGLARVNQDVKAGDPLVYVRSITGDRAAVAAVAPVDGRVLRVTVRAGGHVDIGEIVAAIQPQ